MGTLIINHKFNTKNLDDFRLNERIFVRNNKHSSWQLKRFMSVINKSDILLCKTTDNFTYKYCIPAEGNEELLFKVTPGDEGILKEKIEHHTSYNICYTLGGEIKV